ncbi:protein POF1B isoform X2 [Salvelinus namaycush]|uniref:Protein POF1B isoform X2 n=1 Tax=Salvelinus namaycush TaxID=8040 RepID=A0A8U1BY30_SALNM|nr:protein POF1B isoform X2 [Salvelinus namaycush]
MVNIVKKKVVKRVIESVSQVGIKNEVREVEPMVKMDTRFFGELLAEVYRKNCDIHTCISEHVAKIRGRKHLLDPSNDYKVEREDIEALIPKGASELTKQQLRYLLQTRMTADKTMRLLLTTFSSLREELIHMSEDLRRLESEKESLERDLSFKADQAEQYDRLLEAIRENNRQLQISLKETSSSQRTLETQLLSSRTTDSNRDFRIKELEGSYRALEKENEMLKQKLAGQCSSSTIQMNTEELSRQYSEQLAALRQEKDKELQSLRTQLTRITTEYTTERSGDKSLHLRITQLLTTLEQREVVIKRQEEEIWQLQQEKKRDSSKNVTTTTITKRYRNQYPLLGLLTDDYNSTSPVKDTKTIVIESRTGEMIKQDRQQRRGGNQRACGQGAHQRGGQRARQRGGQGARQIGGQGARQRGGQGAHQRGGQRARQRGGQGARQIGGQGARQRGGQGAHQRGGQRARQRGGQGARQIGGQGAH